MKLQSFAFNHIKSFKSLEFDLSQTSVLIGQNDHGKSSILKALDIVLNQLTKETLSAGALHPDMAEKLLPVFPVQAKARRITLRYTDGNKLKELYVTVRGDLTFIVHENIERNAKTTDAALNRLDALRKSNKFVLIPALRDSTSSSFQEIFSRLLRERSLASIIPTRAGGTLKEYRTLREVRDKIASSIKPYMDASLLPDIEQHFGFPPEHRLALKFTADVEDIGEWILSKLQLGFQLTDDSTSTVSLSEAGSGIQSGVLLALHRLEQRAAEDPSTNFLLAVEEPEAFLHPQRQRELYQNILSKPQDNLKIIVTTHSPYIVADTPFSRLGLVKKTSEYSSLHVPVIESPRDREIFDTFSDEVNSQIFFADRVVFVEGESDARVLRLLLQKRLGAIAHRTSVISAGGNQHFSPFLKMIRAWSTARIPHLIVTDFDSLTKETDRAIVVGARGAGYTISNEATLFTKIDSALDKDDKEFRAAADSAMTQLAAVGLRTFVFTSDLEYSLITDANKEAVGRIFNEVVNHQQIDYRQGYDLAALRRLIGSKGVPLNPAKDPQFKKPFIHRKIADTINLKKAHKDVDQLLQAIEETV